MFDKRKLLYVEDDSISWLAAEASLESKYSMFRARNAREAFDLMKDHSFDIVLMDVQLRNSELDGVGIAKVLRGQIAPPHYATGYSANGTKIIFVTAYSACYDRSELMEMGGDDVVSKPVDFTRLSLAMSRLVVRRAFEDQPQVKKVLEERAQSDRRRHIRVDIPVDFEASLMLRGQEQLVRPTDISKGGARLKVIDYHRDTAPKSGDFVGLSILTPWGEFRAQCKVVREITGPDDLGVEFRLISDDAKDILERWLRPS